MAWVLQIILLGAAFEDYSKASKGIQWHENDTSTLWASVLAHLLSSVIQGVVYNP